MSSSHRTRSTKEPAVEKQDKFPVLTMSPFKIMALPKLRGVAGLTLIEIKDDLKELIPQSDDNDTDSDCSLLSEDILDSVYPVAPRSAPRSAGNSSLPDYASAGSCNVSNDEAMYLINDISKTHKELYENEKYREEMETQCEAYDANLEMEKNVFANSRKEYENYLKLVQGLYARNVRLHTAYSRQNSLLHHLHCNLQAQKTTELMVQTENNKLRALIASAKGKQNGKTAAGTSEDLAAVDGSVSILRVRLQKSGVEVVLHRGMTIPTPMGDGEIASIYPESRKLAIKLPYGMMHAHLPRAVGWLQTALPAVNEDNMLVSTASVHGVQQIYQERLYNRLTVPHRQAIAIQALMAQQRRGEDETGAMTDHDDASGDEASELEATDSSAPSLSEHPQLQDNNGTAMDIDGAESAEATAGRNNSRRSGGEPALASSTVATAASEGREHVPVFPLPCVSASPPARAVAKRDLEAALQEKYSQLLLHTLPLAFAPAASLPHVVDQLNSHSKSQHNPLCQGDIEFDLHALQSLYSSYPATLLRAHESGGAEDGSAGQDGVAGAGLGQPGATGSLAWHGDVEHMQSSLKMVHDQIRELEAEQQQRIAEIERARSVSSQLTTSATTIRLNMFTRRLAHRTNLSNRGIVLPTAAPAPAQSGKARNQANSARNSANNINGLVGAAGEGAGAGMAMLLAAGESRSSRSKRSSASLKSESSAGNQQNADGMDGFVRKAQMLRSAAESPFSTTQSVQDEAPSTGERPAANSRRRAAAGGGLTVKDEVVVGNKRRAVAAGSSRRANEDIVASAGEVDQQTAGGGGAGTADEGTVADSDSGVSTSRQQTARGETAAAAKKKPKRRRY